MRYAIVETATGRVVNIIELEPDDEGSYDHWQNPHAGTEVIDGTDCDGVGWSWDGQIFTPPTPAAISRIDELMNGKPPPDEATLAAERTELLNLLHAKLDDTGDLTWAQMNKMLALERES